MRLPSSWMTPRPHRTAFVIVIAVLLLGACGSSRPVPSSTQIPGSASSTASPGVSTAAMTPSGGSIEPGVGNDEPSEDSDPPGLDLGDPLLNSVVVTVSDRVRVRSEPRVSDDSIKYEPVLPLGTELRVLDGPVNASGYTWYQVAPVSFAALDGPGYGWVAQAGKDGEPWITTCSPRYDLATLASMGDYLALACSGDQEITLMARVAPFDGLACGDLYTIEPWWIEPLWLDPCSFDVFLGPLEGERNYDFPVKLDPAIDRATLPEFFDDLGNSIWTTVEVTGQYDHPEARTCRGKSHPDGEQPPKPEAVVAYCRSQFVVTSIQVADEP